MKLLNFNPTNKKIGENNINKTYNSSNLFFTLFIMIFLSSCGNEKIEIPIDSLNTCDDTTEVTYRGEIKKLVEKRCINEGCHCPSCPPANFKAGVYLHEYSEVKKYAVNGELLKKVKPGNPPQMPFALPALSDCDIRKFERWVKADSPE